MIWHHHQRLPRAHQARARRSPLYHLQLGQQPNLRHVDMARSMQLHQVSQSNSAQDKNMQKWKRRSQRCDEPHKSREITSMKTSSKKHEQTKQNHKAAKHCGCHMDLWWNLTSLRTTHIEFLTVLTVLKSTVLLPQPSPITIAISHIDIHMSF